MYKKYKLPLNIFLILEHLNIFIFTSKLLKPNHFIFLLKKNSFFLFNLILKNDFFLNTSTLIDISAIDKNNYENNFLLKNKNFLKKNIIIFYHYYLYFKKNKLTILLLLNNNKNKLKSIDNIYKNANWLERECSEMFKINFSFKKDIRKLLLNYISNENPLLKNFPSEGTSDVFFNFFENQIVLNNNNNIEL